MFTEFVKAFRDEVNPGLSSVELSELEVSLQPFKLTDELKQLYLEFNGVGELEKTGVWILEFDEALEERKNYRDMHNSENKEFPPALFPIAGYNEGNYWVPLATSSCAESPVFEYAVAQGDTEIFLMYNSVEGFIKTLLGEKAIYETNKHPGNSEHYVDNAALNAVQKELNPDMYNYEQKGNKSKNGVVNVYEVSEFVSSWKEPV